MTVLEAIEILRRQTGTPEETAAARALLRDAPPAEILEAWDARRAAREGATA